MNSLVKKIYLYRAADDFMLLYPFYTVLFADHGLSTMQISVLLVAWSATAIIMEVPSGVWADKYSRKNLLAIGQIIRAVGYLCWLIIPGFTGFLIGFILWGIKSALSSGTYEALLYDELKALDEEKSYVRVAGKAESVSLVANFAATLLAAIAILGGYQVVLVGSILAVIVAAFAAFSLPENKKILGVEDKKYFTILRTGITQVWSNKALVKIVLFSSFIGVMYGALEEYISLFVKDAGISQPFIPIAVAVTGLAAVVASYVAHRYEKLDSSQLVALLGLSGGILFAAAVLMNTSGVALLAVYIFLIKLLNVIFDGRLQHAIEGDVRATVTSVNGFIGEIAGVFAYLVFGAVAELHSRPEAFGFFAITAVTVAITYLIMRPKKLFKVRLT